MHDWGIRSRRWTTALAAAVLVLALPACGGGGGGGGGSNPTVTASFTSNDTTLADHVRLLSVTSSGSNITLRVAIGGPTTSNDYYGFAFDLLIGDTTVAQFVNASAVAGPFLTGIVNAVASQSGDHVVVGVSKQGAVAGNGSTAAETGVVDLTFEVLKVGDTTLTFSGFTGGVPPAGANCGNGTPEALDSNLDCIASTIFGAGGTLSGS